MGRAGIISGASWLGRVGNGASWYGGLAGFGRIGGNPVVVVVDKVVNNNLCRLSFI